MQFFTFVKIYYSNERTNTLTVLTSSNGKIEKSTAGEKTRQQVLRAALQVINQEGVDAVTHRRVGLAAGLSHGVVGYHFPTREELIHRAFEFYLGSFQDYLVKIGWDRTKTMTKPQIVAVLTRAVAEEIADGASIRLELELSLYGSRKPELANLLNIFLQEGVDKLAHDLKKSGYKQSDHLARALFNLVRGFLLDCLNDQSLTEKDFRKRANAIMASIS